MFRKTNVPCRTYFDARPLRLSGRNARTPISWAGLESANERCCYLFQIARPKSDVRHISLAKQFSGKSVEPDFELLCRAPQNWRIGVRFQWLVELRCILDGRFPASEVARRSSAASDVQKSRSPGPRTSGRISSQSSRRLNACTFTFRKTNARGVDLSQKQVSGEMRAHSSNPC